MADTKANKYSKLMFSSKNQEAETPKEVWDFLKKEFTDNIFDPCPSNPTVDGLSIPWPKEGIVYCNPPFKQCSEWMQKCVQEFIHGSKIICLIPARVNTNWYHRWVLPYATEIRFVKNGVKFMNNGVSYKRKSPFPVCIVVFDPKQKGTQKFGSVDFYQTKKRVFPQKEGPVKKQCGKQ